MHPCSLTYMHHCKHIQQLRSGLLQAYALYRLNRLQDALQILSHNMADTPAKSLLEAQLQHRLGNYAAAIAIYNTLVQQRKVCLSQTMICE